MSFQPSGLTHPSLPNHSLLQATSPLLGKSVSHPHVCHPASDPVHPARFILSTSNIVHGLVCACFHTLPPIPFLCSLISANVSHGDRIIDTCHIGVNCFTWDCHELSLSLNCTKVVGNPACLKIVRVSSGFRDPRSHLFLLFALFSTITH